MIILEIYLAGAIPIFLWCIWVHYRDGLEGKWILASATALVWPIFMIWATLFSISELRQGVRRRKMR